MLANMEVILKKLLANWSGKSWKSTMNGRSYLVAPLTLIVPGVLNGSRGPVLYPDDETRKSTLSWNGVPIVGYHPFVNGHPVSARDPDILQNQGIGSVYRARMSERLAAEGWFDEVLTRNFDERLPDAKTRLWPRLEKGEPIEVSTGLGVVLEPASPNSVFNGISYHSTARNFQPDHLAVLPDQVGACSLKDGCGVFNADRLSHEMLRSRLQHALQKRFPTGHSYSEGRRMEVDYDDHCYILDVYDKTVVYAKKGKTYRLGYSTDLRTGEVTLSSDKPVEVRKVISYKPALNSQPEQYSLSYESSEETIPEGAIVAESDEEEVVSNTIRKLRSGKYRLYSKSGKNLGTFSSREKAEKHEREVDYFKTHAHNEEKVMKREEIIDWLVANCACWKGQGDREVLNGLSDDKLKNLKDQAEQQRRYQEAADAAKKGFTDPGGNTHTWNETTKQWDRKEAPKKEETVVNEGEAPRLTAEEQATLAWAQAEMARQRQILIDQITANSKPEVKTTLVERLKNKPLDELRDLALLVPAPTTNGIPGQTVTPLYGPGASTPSSGQVQNADDENDILVAPTINWEGEREEFRKKRIRVG